MIRQHVTCPRCLVPFTRTIAGDRPLVPGGWYYPPAQANWCTECRLGVRWFPAEETVDHINGIAYLTPFGESSAPLIAGPK